MSWFKSVNSIWHSVTNSEFFSSNLPAGLVSAVLSVLRCASAAPALFCVNHLIFCQVLAVSSSVFAMNLLAEQEMLQLATLWPSAAVWGWFAAYLVGIALLGLILPGGTVAGTELVCKLIAANRGADQLCSPMARA